MSIDLDGDRGVPDACTLPTVERPARAAEFDDLFARDVLAVAQETPERVRLHLRATPETVSRAAALAMKETACCTFFTFGLAIADGTASLSIETGPAQGSVLAALATRARASRRADS